LPFTVKLVAMCPPEICARAGHAAALKMVRDPG
jgi:hypothetical protein